MKRVEHNLVEVANGRIRFETLCPEVGVNEERRVFIVPLATFSMSMLIIDEEEGKYRHYFYDNTRAIEVDGATWMEAQELIFDK